MLETGETHVGVLYGSLAVVCIVLGILAVKLEKTGLLVGPSAVF